MYDKEQNVKPIYVYILSIPMSLVYVILVASTDSSFTTATLGYLMFGISLGLIQSLIKLKKPYRVAFLSILSVPLAAYILLTLLSILLFWAIASDVIVQTSSGGAELPNVSGGVIPINPLPYTSQLGFAGGIILYMIVLAILVILFGFIGMAGRFVGDQIIPSLMEKFLKEKSYYRKEDGGVLIERLLPSEPDKTKISSNATIVVAVVSAIASIIIALVN